jgi:hypothetical protein
MRQTKHLKSAIQFTNWCRNQNLDPVHVAHLYALAKKAHRAGVAAANGASRSRSQVVMRAFEKSAGGLGFTTTWGSLWPTLHKDGHEVWLPDFGL